MRRRNLPDGGNLKMYQITTNKASWQRNSDTWWRLTTATLLSILFGSCRRRRRDVPLRPLVEVTLRCYWVFHLRLVWDVVETLLRPLETFSRRSNKALWRRTTETSWQRSTELLLGVSFETYLWRCWDVPRDVVTTFLRRLVAG